jgi:L-ascorbate metabolism protein UlaG (beta-lactamase superfamily)
MKVTWYGHSAFRIDHGGAAILIDPFLSHNPVWKGGWEKPAEGVTHVLLTHGHDDHIGDAAQILKKTGAQLVANFEICMHLVGQGVSQDNINPGNHGGTVTCGGFTTTFVNAHHSSSSNGVYLGNPCGLVLHFPDGECIYHMGDTDIFGDMALINEIYAPSIGMVPIGDRFTMGAKTAAMAVKRYFAFDTVIPCHYGSFGIIDPTADAFRAEMAGNRTKVLVPEKGVAVGV